MWEEIPEGLLPSQALGARDSLALVPARAEERWRIRVCGAASGSWWTDVKPKTAGATITVAPADPVDVAVETQARTAIGGAVLSIGDMPRGTAAPHRLAILQASTRGTLRLSGIPDAQPISVMVSQSKYVPYVATTTVKSFPATIVLQRGFELHGRVVDDRRRPIAEALVHLEMVVSPQEAVLLAKDVKTDTSGSFAFAQLPNRPAVVVASKKGFAAERRQIEISPTGRMEPVVLHQGRAIKVLVTDDGNRPLAGVHLSVAPSADAETDRHGIALLADLPASAVTLRAQHKGFLDTSANADARDREVSIRMPSAFVVHGRFAATGETIRVKKVDGSTESTETLPRDGTFELDLLPEHAVNLLFSSDADEPLDVAVDAGASGEVRDLGVLRPRSGASVNGRVIRSQNGNPVAGAHIWVPRHSAGGPVAAWATGNIAECRTDANGAFHLAGLPDGPVTLRVEYPGLARARVQAVVGGSEETVVELHEGATVIVSFNDPSTSGVARLESDDDGLDFDRASASLTDGKAVFRNVPPGPAQLNVAQGRRSICVQHINVSDGEQRDISCADHPIIVRGNVMFGRAAAHGGTLYWEQPGSQHTQGVIITHRSAAGAEQQQIYGADSSPVAVSLRSDGTFETSELNQGSYGVIWMSAGGTLSHRVSVSVPEGEEPFVSVVFPGAVLRGEVLDENGKPVMGARVRELDGHAASISDGNGHFEVPGLSPGTVRVQATSGNFSSAVTPVLLDEARSEEVTLRLERDTQRKIAVHILRTDGAPAASALIVMDTGNGGSDVLTADGSGTAAVSFPEGLPERVRFAAWVGDRWSLGEWASGTAARDDGVVLRAGSDGATLKITAKSAGVPIVESGSSWNISWLMTLLGARPAVAANAPAVIAGIPAGQYRIVLGSDVRVVTVRTPASDVAFP